MDLTNLTPEQRKFVGSEFQISKRYQSFLLTPQDMKVPSSQKSDSVKLCMGEKIPAVAPASTPKKREKTTPELYRENMNQGADTKFLLQPYGHFPQSKIDWQQQVRPPQGVVKERIGDMEVNLNEGVIKNTLPKGTSWLDVNHLVAGSK